MVAVGEQAGRDWAVAAGLAIGEMKVEALLAEGGQRDLSEGTGVDDAVRL